MFSNNMDEIGFAAWVNVVDGRHLFRCLPSQMSGSSELYTVNGHVALAMVLLKLRHVENCFKSCLQCYECHICYDRLWIYHVYIVQCPCLGQILWCSGWRHFCLNFVACVSPFIREVVSCWCFWLSTCNVRFSSSTPSTKPGKPWEKARTTASSALVATSDLSSPWVNPFGCWVAPYYNARKAFKIIQVKFMQVGFGMPWASIVML